MTEPGSQAGLPDAVTDPARAIVHVDMDAFFAAVEVLDDPSLAGRPVIVGGTPAGRGVVAAASYEARRYGVRSAMSAARALRLCPEAIVRRPRLSRYLEISGQVLAILRAFTPVIEPLSIDEAFLDVTGSRGIFGPAPAIGRAIKRRILDELGLVASVGIAPNKFLAKLASDLEKPDGFVVITAQEARARLAPLPVGRLWGVGRVTEAQLAQHGVATIADLLAVPPERLRSWLGEHADHLRRLAVGQDDRPVATDHEVKSVGNETTFAEDIADPLQLAAILDQLAEKVAWRLRRAGLAGCTVTLKARYPDFTTCTRSVTLPGPTQSTVAIRQAARQLLAQRLGRRGRSLRLLGVTVSHLGPVDAGPLELFTDLSLQREQTLDRVLDQVNERFGRVLRRGGPPRSQDETGPGGAREG